MMLNSKTTTVVKLWSGDKHTSGTLTLNDYISNYDIIIIILKTNNQYWQDILFNGQGVISVGGNTSYDHVDADGGYRSIMQYNMWDNKLYCFATYNNSNWILGVIGVYGMKIH